MRARAQLKSTRGGECESRLRITRLLPNAAEAQPRNIKHEHLKSGEGKSRERKRSKRLKRQQPERKEKYRERQRRANRKQHRKLSKPSARHDMQRQRNANARATVIA
jgi:hypothetical protein